MVSAGSIPVRRECHSLCHAMQWRNRVTAGAAIVAKRKFRRV
jgi:hypothetical protein